MRLCEYVGIPSLFQGRVSGVGGIISDLMQGQVYCIQAPCNQVPISGGQRACIGPDCQMDGGIGKLQVCHPNSPAGTCKPVDWKPDADVYDVLKQRELESQKKLKDAKSWRSNTPIFSWTTTSPSGDPRTVKVYGYNKELKAVWLAEGPSASADNSMLISEAGLASKSPEWVAWKSGSTSGLPLPILLGAAYLLLA